MFIRYTALLLQIQLSPRERKSSGIEAEKETVTGANDPQKRPVVVLGINGYIREILLALAYDRNPLWAPAYDSFDVD